MPSLTILLAARAQRLVFAGFACAWLLNSSIARADIVDDCASDAEAANALRKSGKLTTALTKLTSCAREVCPRVVRDDCRASLQELSEKGPHLVVRSQNIAGDDLPNARVSLDAVPLTNEQVTRGVLVDTGNHRIRVEASGYKPLEREVLVTIGDGLRSIHMQLTGNDNGIATSSKNRQVDPEAIATPTPNRMPAYVVGGVGLATLVVGGVLSISTFSRYSTLEKCSPFCATSDVDSARRQALIGDILLGSGLVTTAVAVVLWFTAGSKETTRFANPLQRRF
jgi:PEGA domain